MKGKAHGIKWLVLLCLDVIVAGSFPFETTNYCILNQIWININSNGLILSSRFSYNLCRFISLINAFLMTQCVCVSKTSNSLNFSNPTCAVLRRWRERERERERERGVYRLFQWVQGSAFPCQGSPPAVDVLQRHTANTIDTTGKRAHESLNCFSVYAWMKLNYDQHLPLLYFVVNLKVAEQYNYNTNRQVVLKVGMGIWRNFFDRSLGKLTINYWLSYYFFVLEMPMTENKKYSAFSSINFLF